MDNIIVAPSLLSCDFSRIGEEVKAVEKAGADWLHVDIMDGHFVPNITIGPAVVAAIKKTASIPLDVHLMISEPDKYIRDFIDAGADFLTVHQETCTHPHRTLSAIRDSGAKSGISINPATPAESILNALNETDLILFMTVNPGFGGQQFIPDAMDKVAVIKNRIERLKHKIFLSVDGGINAETGRIARESGIEVLVAGSFIFESPDYRTAIQSLRQ